MSNNQQYTWQKAAITMMVVLVVLAFTLLYLHGCSTGPATTVATSNPGCSDGSPIGAERDIACPSGPGNDHQVCTAIGWRDVTNTCNAAPAPCKQTLFADVQPTLQQFCTSCHATMAQYSAAQANAPEISRRVGLPSGNNDHMPQGTAPQASAEQVTALQKWVSDGAFNQCPVDTGGTATTISEDYIATAMVQDASQLTVGDRPFTRYLVTADAVNMKATGSGGIKATATPAGTAQSIQTWIDAMNKAVNSLSATNQDLKPVQSIEPTKSVWRIDLRDYGINAAGIAAIEAGDVNINIVDNTSKGLVLQTLLGTTKPWFHASNFIDVTFRNSNVYHTLLNVQATLLDQQKLLGVNFVGDLANLQNVNFIGSNQSPIAEQKNRLIVRDIQARSQNSYYWQTFDVNAVAAAPVNTKNLFQFPLLAGTGGGNGTTASVENFTSDASETIWQLPNGLQGYALWDAAGNRVNFADPNIVIDTATPLSNHIINTANSCGRCHNQGLIPFQDQVLGHVAANAAQFLANDVQLVQSVYRGAVANTALFNRDNAPFSQALAKLGIQPGPDPMSVITDQFLQEWDLQQAAAFLLLSPAQMAQAINVSPTAKTQIGTLLTGGNVTFGQFTAVLQQLIKDANLFKDPLN